jgi:hypothetical protein
MSIISDEAKSLHLEVARLRPGRARKYTPVLRRRILAWVDRAKQSGMLDIDCSNALGIPQHRFEMWRRYEQRPTRPQRTPKALRKTAPKVGTSTRGGKRPGAGRPRKHPATIDVVGQEKTAEVKRSERLEEATALVPVDIPPVIHLTPGLTFVTPRGLRIEGVTFEQAYALLREFS